MRIMTSNIWGDYFGNPPSGRDEKLLAVYGRYAPDVIGFQEVTKAWYESALFENLSGKYYFLGTECIGSNIHVPVAVSKQYTLVAKGFEYLEDTPDESKSITWGVVKKDGVHVAFCNTHFWWMCGKEPDHVRKQAGVLDFTYEDHCALRAKNAAQLAKLMHYLHDRYGCPVFAFGDMNAPVSHSIFRVYAENGIKNLFDMTENRDLVCTIHGNPVRGEDGIYHGNRATAEYLGRLCNTFRLTEGAGEGHAASIDHIVGLSDTFSVKQYRVIEDQDALDATDHSPVYADIAFLA